MPETKTNQGTSLLGDDGDASIATMFMSAHHGFRRDLALFGTTLRSPAAGEPDRAKALREEWEKFRGTIHTHHTVEDTQMFPGLRGQNAALGPVIDRLDSEHRRIDPLLELGDRAFADLPRSTDAAAGVVAELAALVDAHLTFEEANVVPSLRAVRAFPPPASDADAEMYAHGFAWSLHGLAPAVVEQMLKMLPEILTSKVPAARAAYAARCERVWGTAKTGASRTSVPDWLAIC